MNIFRTLLAVLFALWVLPASSFAQDDLDLESLLDDLSDEPAVEETVVDEGTAADTTEGDLLDAELLLLEDEETDFASASEEDDLAALLDDDVDMTEEEDLGLDFGDDELVTEAEGAAYEESVEEADLGMDDDDLFSDIDEETMALLEESEPAGADEDMLSEADMMDDLLAEESDDDLIAELEAEEDMLAGAVGEEEAEEGAGAEAAMEDDLLTALEDTVEPEGGMDDDFDLLMMDEDVEPAGLDEPMGYVATDVAVPVEEPAGAIYVEEEIYRAPRRAPVTQAATPKAAELSKEEEVRRQAMELEGLKKLDQGFSSLDSGRYEEAIEAFNEALEMIPERPATREDRERAAWGHAEADYKLARELYRADTPQLEEAQEYVASALSYSPDNRAAKSLQRKIERAIERQEELKGRPVPARKDPVVVERKENVSSLIRQGRDYYSIADYDMAEALFDKVLVLDEYNITAMRYLRKISQKKERISDTMYEATKAKAMAKVRETWTPPIREEVQLPDPVAKGPSVKKQTDAEQLREKMSTIVIPKIEFRDANIQDVVDFLAEASQAADPEQQGVNIVLHMGDANQEKAQAAAPAQQPVQQDFGGFEFDDAFGFEEEFQEETFNQGPSSGISLTLNLHRISLLDAIKTITEIAGLRYRIDGNIVIITPQNFATGQIITRLYPVQPTIIDVVISRDDSSMDKQGDFVEMGSATSIRREDVKDFFERTGVPFPPGTSITYNSAISQLIVANTAENLEKFERILAQLNVIPNQVEIEARFIEIGENDLRELGLEWILNDNWEIATRNGSGPVSGRERVQVNKNENGFTQGLRFFGYNAQNAAINAGSAVTRGNATPMGGILSISSILTNPELSVVLHALDQNGGTDLLSAPRVTARSGYNATIEVVQEIIYPTEFDAQSQSVGTGAAESTDRTVVVVTPGSFETREVGVILNVTPTVGPDGYTIDLAMVPEVSELVGWLEYGSTIGDVAYNMPQPIFSSRNVTTSIVIWDGQTVVMGGMIREELTTVNDKIPLLGDIPFLGRLFRNEGEYSKKKNLLIFVTARLVDPAGKPIHKQDTVGGMPGTESVPANPS
jgi:general secretion pathway protein D